MYPVCRAFPHGIPDIIKQGTSDHSLPLAETFPDAPKEMLDDDGKPIIFEPYSSMKGEKSYHVLFDRSASLDDITDMISAMVHKRQDETPRREDDNKKKIN